MSGPSPAGCPGRAGRDRLRTQDRNELEPAGHRAGRLLRGDLLATAAGLDRGRRLAGPARTAAGPTARARRARPGRGRGRRLAHPSPQRGDHVGPSPVDRGRPGSKHHLICDAGGIPLAVSLTGGNRNDITQLIPLVPAVPPIRGRRGRPRRRPGELFPAPGRTERVLVKVNRSEELLEELRQLIGVYGRHQHFELIPARLVVQPDGGYSRSTGPSRCTATDLTPPSSATWRTTCAAHSITWRGSWSRRTVAPRATSRISRPRSRSETWRKELRIHGAVDPGVLKVIDELQPYNVMPESPTDADLWHLHRLDISCSRW